MSEAIGESIFSHPLALDIELPIGPGGLCARWTFSICLALRNE